MPRLMLACAGAMLIACAGADAADLRPSRLGAVFADPVVPHRPVGRTVETDFVYAPEVDVRPAVQGYYGKPNSFLYRSYYGTPPAAIFGRLPYACGFYGYC